MPDTEDRIEEIIEESLEALEERQDDFTAWERDFLESVEDHNEQGHLTEAQIEKLIEIYEDKVLR